MRLTREQISAIKQAVETVFGPAAEVRLFGSRADDNRRGGDIDLYIEVPATADITSHLPDLKARLLRHLWQALGPQRIDLLIRTRRQPLTNIHRDAIEHGIVL